MVHVVNASADLKIDHTAATRACCKTSTTQKNKLGGHVFISVCVRSEVNFIVILLVDHLIVHVAVHDVAAHECAWMHEHKTC